jgi:fructokinase
LKNEVIGIGEVLIDFVGLKPVSYLEVSMFQKCFGGAPMNTLIGVSRLGSSTGAITSVGDDPFGQFLVDELNKNGVDTSHVKVKKGMRTTISFVTNEPKTGERTFIFYRRPWVRGTADCMLSLEDADLDYISRASILHVSGFSLSQNPSRKAVLSAVKHAKEMGVKVSFDPTLRIDVWQSERTIRRLYSQILHMSDIATFSREEAEFVFGKRQNSYSGQAAWKKRLKTL